MSEPNPNPSLPPLRCIHLYCKAMMVFGEDFESDPDFQAGMTDFWCLKTQTGHGPDKCEVSLEQCRDPQRSCYQQF